MGCSNCYLKIMLIKYCNNLRYIVILWDKAFGKNNNINQNFLKILTDHSEIPFFDLKYMVRLFPNLEKVEYFNGSLNKTQITTLKNSIVEKAQKIDDEDATHYNSP